MRRIQVAVVEDQPDTYQRLTQALLAATSVELVFATRLGQDMLNWLQHQQPDVLLVDLGLPDVPGLEVIAACHRLHPAVEIMVVTMFGDEATMLKAFAKGARGYLLKDGSELELARHVCDIHAGGSPMTPVIARRLLALLHPVGSSSVPLLSRPEQTLPPKGKAVAGVLSDRELEVLTLLARGFTYSEVAQLLGVALSTIQAHVKGIYQKLEVRSRAEAVFEARQMGLLG